jgi:hypothetical protein
VLACSPPVEEMMGLILGSVKKVLDKDHADPLNVQLLIVVNVKIFKFLNKNIKMLLVVMQDVQLKEKDFHWKS